VGAFVAAHDDHTLLYTVAGSVTVAPLLIDRLPYDVDHDLVPIVPSLSVIVTVAVNAALPVRTLDDLVKLAHEQPGRLTWSAGPTRPARSFSAAPRRNSRPRSQTSAPASARPPSSSTCVARSKHVPAKWPPVRRQEHASLENPQPGETAR